MADHGSPRLGQILRRGVEIPPAVLAVAQVSFRLQVAEHGADGGVARRLGKFRANIRYRRLTQSEDDLEDFPFSLAQFSRWRSNAPSLEEQPLYLLLLIS